MNLTKQELLELRRMLVQLLKEVDFQIEAYDPREDDEKFDFLIKKARSYRDVIVRINQELEEL
ncbi:hypothetical protein [Runella sp.]|jgi:hypothetical protein|uniref:hypothetical protein n=1 Tax=Runella sp. TaxID=1960881 RepID=UPI003018F173